MGVDLFLILLADQYKQSYFAVIFIYKILQINGILLILLKTIATAAD